jgi:PAS domain S-box-containing protein
LILTLCLLAYAAVIAWTSWGDEKANSVKELSTVTALEAKAIDNYFMHLESGLKGLAEDLIAQGAALDSEPTYRLVKKFKALHTELYNVTLIRPEGDIVLSARIPPGSAQGSLAKEASFIAFIDELKQGKVLGIGQPLIGVQSKVAIVPVRYAHQDAQGHLQFIVSANLPQDYLQSFWVDAPITAKSAIGLIRDNGFLLSRYPVPVNLTLAQIYGQPRTGALINTLQAQGFPASGYVEGPSSLDGPDFLTAFRRLAHYPVTAFVALPLSEVRAAWWKRMRDTYLALLLLLIGGYLSYGVAVRRQKKWDREQKRLEEAQRASEQRFRHLIEHNNAIILQVDAANGQIVAANAAAVNFYGWTHDELCAKTVQEINQLPPAEIAVELAAAAKGQRNTFIFPHRLASGEIRTVEVHSTPIDDGGRTVLVSIIHDISERVRQEKQLSRVLQEQAAILNSRIVGIVKLKERKFVWSNAAFADMLGYTEEELSGQSSRLVYPSDQAHAEFAAAAYPVLQRGEIFRTEIQYRRKDGSLGWYEIGGGLLAPGSDESIWSSIDITARKEGEIALDQAHQAIKEAQRLAKVGSWQRDLRTDAVVWSDEMYRIHGCDPQQFVATPETFLATIHPQDRDRAIAAYHAAVEQHRPLDLTHRVQLLDGALKHVHVLGEVFFAADGSPLRIAGTTQDISQQVLQEAQLRESEERLRSLFFAMAEGLVVQEADGRVIDVNPAAEQILGLSRDEMLGRTSADVRWQAIREDGTAFPSAEHPAMVTLRSGQAQRAIVMGITAPNRGAGDVRWININAQPAPGKDPTTPRTVITTFTDITETRAAQAELARHRQHLELLVDERTVSLCIAKDAAEAANRAKSVFLTTMTHELRTPMNGIIGMTSIAQRRASEPKMVDYLGKIMQSAQRLLAIINNIIDISELEAKHMSLETMDFTLEGMRAKLQALLADDAQQKGLQLVIDIPPELAERSLRGDPLRLGQVIAQLTANAIKFTAQGSVSVRAALCGESQDEVQVRFEVTDSGIGISAEDQKHLFTVFEQVDGSMTRQYGGTGLGLAISQRLVQAMGGSIGVVSQLGAGTTFWLVVPLKKAPVAEIRRVLAHAATESAESVLLRDYRGQRVLLVEDDVINQEIALFLLKEVGLEADLATNGEQAIDLAAQNHYAAILMDLQLPGISGLEATRAIRLLPGAAATPILATTASVADQDHEQCRAAGLNDFIAKPIDPALMFATLLKWLARPPG